MATTGLQIKVESDFERCICCGKLTDVRRDTPIDERTCYVEGAGQLLPECYRSIYGPSRTEETRVKIWLREMGFVF